ncbi:MBL fold metallo-hydrolase [Meiothermus sp. QL-1]|uniref:MBL fold metallo-hydrolase n=1 Tax=Meiothermus sp. QL-1 TaxID=2058095 RepID=UPI000E0B3CCB|nr:MBL fold metallo-hydrolase [Meiothermus sp. QL-1]RDI96162.1 MBL fold metallo-hydrolase [Meiothermus sp. QL-1]
MHQARLSHPVAPGIFAIPIPIPYPFRYVNVYLLLPPPLSTGGPVLVDCALDTPEARAALEGALREHGLGYGDLEALLLTHHHPDHYGLAGLIEQAGVSVYMLDIEEERGHIFWTQAEAMNQAGMAFFRRHGVTDEYLAGLEKELALTRSRVHPVRNPRTFPDGVVLEWAGTRLRVVWVPGHADGQAMFLREEDGVLLAGDQILEKISPNIGRWAYAYPNPLAHYLASLEKTRGLGARLALPGHYRPIADIPGRVAELRAHHQERLAFLEGLLSPEPQTAWQLSLALFPGELSLAQRRFAWAETLAHLEYLVEAGRAVPVELEGILHYRR